MCFPLYVNKSNVNFSKHICTLSFKNNSRLSSYLSDRHLLYASGLDSAVKLNCCSWATANAMVSTERMRILLKSKVKRDSIYLVRFLNSSSIKKNRILIKYMKFKPTKWSSKKNLLPFYSRDYLFWWVEYMIFKLFY